MSNNKPILHQAVLARLHELPVGVLTLSKLISMGFDVNALDANGESALSQIFFTTKRSIYSEDIIEKFQHPDAWAFNVDNLMEHLGNRFSLYGIAGLSPVLLLQLTKYVTPRFLRSEMIGFNNLIDFCTIFENCQTF